MRVAQLWKGIYHFGMSGWYHLGAALAGLTIDTSSTTDFFYYNPSAGVSFEEIKADELIYQFHMVLLFHLIVAFLSCISALLNMKGRQVNEDRGNEQIVNSYLLAQRLVDVAGACIWLQYVCWLAFWCFSFQMCLYNPKDLGTQCYYWFSPPVVYIVFTLNASICYMFGVVTYIVLHMLHSSCINRIISDFQTCVVDFLTVQSKSARWSGYQFMILYMCIITIFWSYSYANIYLNIQQSFVEMELPLLMILLSNLIKMFALQPLQRKMKTLQLEKLKIRSNKMLVKQNLTLKTHENIVKEEEKPKKKKKQESGAINDEDATGSGDSGESELSGVEEDLEEQIGDLEAQQKPMGRIWYMNMLYRLSTDKWYLWVFATMCDCCAVIYFVIKDAYHHNYFETVFMQLYIFQQFCMGCFYLKELWLQEHGGKFSYFKHIVRDAKDFTHTEITPEQLTEAALKTNLICDVGDNIYSKGFLVLQKENVHSMGYSLETVLQAIQIVILTLVIQLCLTACMYIDFASNANWSINYPDSASGMLSRLCFSLVLHVQTERYVRYGLNMMKYTCNHAEKSFSPIMAFIIGFLLFFAGVFITVACMIHLSNQQTTIDMASSYIAYGAICYTPLFVQTGLPAGDILKAEAPKLQIETHRREIEKRSGGDTCMRVIYKTLRIFYCSFWYYFAPILILLLPNKLFNNIEDQKLFKVGLTVWLYIFERFI